MAADNRLSAEQLAARRRRGYRDQRRLRKPRYSTGTVVRHEASCIVVSWRSPRGVSYVHRYATRNGVRIGGGHHAQLVQPEMADTVMTDDGPLRLRRIDALYREWSRDRGDVERLRRLQEAISDCLDNEHRFIGPPSAAGGTAAQA